MNSLRLLAFSVIILSIGCGSPKSDAESAEAQEKESSQVLVSEKSTEEVKAQINKLMSEQEEAWSAGDLEGFMRHYWKSDSLVFVGKKGVNKGWQTTLENYRKSYPDKSAMGELTFENLSIEQLSPHHAFVIGKWHLKREEGDLSGHYSLLWKTIDGSWKIVSDHSS